MRARQRQRRLHAFDETAAPRPRARLALRLLVAVLGLQVLLGTPAVAQGFGCSSPPTPEYAGAGSVVSQVDPPTLGHGLVGSAYDEVAYAGLVWHTYGYSGPCVAADPQAGVDTYLGGILFDVGKVVTAATNGLWYFVQNGGELDQLDEFVNVATPAFYDAVFAPYLAVVLLLVAMVILWRTLQGDLPEIGKKVFWIGAGLWLASTTYLTPLVYTELTDQVLVHGAAELQGNLLKTAGYEDLRDGLPTLLHDQTVVQPWQSGEFGGSTNPQAQQFSKPLWEAQACTKLEVADNSCNTEAKKASYTDIASKLQNTPAYPYFTGAAHARVGAGAQSALRAICYDLFQLVAAAGVVLAQLVVRVVIIGGPVLGLLAMLRTSLMPTVFRSIGNALGQGLILTAAAAGHGFALGWILRPQSGMSPFGQLLVMALVTVALWAAVRPFERLASMTASTVGISMPSWAQRRQTRALQSRRAGDSARRGLGVLGRFLAAQDRNLGRWLAPQQRGARGAGGSASSDGGDAVGPLRRPEGAAAGAAEAPREHQGSTTSRSRTAPSSRSAGEGGSGPAEPRRPRSGAESRSESAPTSTDGPTRRITTPPGSEQPSASATSSTSSSSRTNTPPTRENPGGSSGGAAGPSEPRGPQQPEEPRRRSRRLRPREDGMFPGAVEGQQRSSGSRPENADPNDEQLPLWSEQED